MYLYYKPILPRIGISNSDRRCYEVLRKMFGPFPFTIKNERGSYEMELIKAMNLVFKSIYPECASSLNPYQQILKVIEEDGEITLHCNK